MQMVYLGFFSRIFDWVLSNILAPVYNFVSSLLTSVFTWIFQEILAPILMPVLQSAITFAINLWLTIYSTQLFLLLTGLLKLLDYLQIGFDVFIGLRDVTYINSAGKTVTGSLLDVLLTQESISTAFWALTLGGLGIAFLLTIFGVARSSFDLDFENKRPVSQVLSSFFKTFITFFTVPFFVYFIIKLAAAILRGVSDVMGFGQNTSLGRVLFVICTLDAAKDEGMNVSKAAASKLSSLGITPADTLRYPYYDTTMANSKNYWDLNTVKNDFNLTKLDFLIGYIAVTFLLFTVCTCLVIFVKRIFEVMLLYIVAPYFVSMIPLDSGEKFSRWREQFVGKCFTGFGSAIAMKLYLLICPSIVGNRIKFSSGGSPEAEYMMKLFFLAGGAWAVYKMGSMITSLISSQAGQAEASTGNMVGGMLFAHTIGSAVGAAQRSIKSLGGKLGSSASGKGGEDQKFNGIKAPASQGAKPAWKKTAHRPGNAGRERMAKSGVRIGANRKGFAKSDIKIGANRKAFQPVAPKRDPKARNALAKKGVVMGGHRPSPVVAKARFSLGSSSISKMSNGKYSFNLGRIRSTVDQNGRRSFGVDGLFGKQYDSEGKESLYIKGLYSKSFDAQGGVHVSKLGGLSSKVYHKDGRLDVSRMGGLYSRTQDTAGNTKTRVLGCGYTRDAQGNTTSVKYPFVSRSMGADKQFHVDNVHIPGIATMKTNTDSGHLYFSDIKLAGYHATETGTDATLKKDVSWGNFSYQRDALNDERHLSYGKSMSIGSNADGRIDSVKLGALQFTRDGVRSQNK